MRYRLRTLLIVTGILPPIIAVLWYLALNQPLAFPGMACFAIFWLACGWFWLTLMRALEDYGKTLRK